MKGLDTIVLIDGVEVAAQVGATLRRDSKMADVSNKIEMQWYEGLPQFNSWELMLNGSYVLDNQCFAKIEEAFLNHRPIEIKLQESTQSFRGVGYITSFPLGAQFNKEVTYSMTVKGTGKLNLV